MIKILPDKNGLPPGAQVHVTLTDPQLNIDPTDEDSWTWDTLAASNSVCYQAFDENGTPDADNGAGGMSNIIANLTSFMFEKNG